MFKKTMRTYLECIPCFMKQAIEMARLVTGNEIVHKKIVDEVAKMIPEFSLGASPPAMARRIHQVMEKHIGRIDFYKDIKRKSNERALELYPRLKDKVDRSVNRLLTAVEIAIAGNVIDYAVKNTLNIEHEIDKIFREDFSEIGKTAFAFEAFQEDWGRAETVLYLADNAGEVVFDRVLIEECPPDKKVFYAVRGKAVINDALVEDAEFCGIGDRAQIITSGVDAPGTILKYCAREFVDLFNRADLVISKGQGNYEALSDITRKVYFLFRAKCPVIAAHANVPLGDVVLLKG